MALTAGTKLGPYEIVSPLGAGGMGEVYRARDTRLQRDVAIKVLSASFSRDPERLRRFEFEARAAGALNHPNILTIFEIDTHDAAPYLVTELLEGETLQQRMREGALPVRKALEIAVQTAHGIAAAHDKGIVHRDLKPANIFITTDGRAKILDFGLAKLTQSDPAAGATTTDGQSQMTQAPTAAANGGAGVGPLTEEGVVLGTAGYMSPEQVRGKPADARSDIFALGTILYEMLSGERAFQRDSSADTMAAILKEDPPELAGEGKKIPPGVDRVVRHALEKNPTERFQSARDFAFDLDSLSGGSATSSTNASGANAAIIAAAAEPEKLSPAKKIALAVGGLALVAAGAIAGLLYTRATWRPAPPTFKRLTFRRGYIDTGRFNPDGQTVVYTATWDGHTSDVYEMRLGSAESRSLGLPAATGVLAISSKGEMAVSLNQHVSGAFQYAGTLADVGASGSAPRELATDVTVADWDPDGTKLAVVRMHPGAPETLEYPLGKVLYQAQTGWIGDARVSPDGQHIAFVDHLQLNDDAGQIAVIDLAGKKTTLTRGWSSARGLAWCGNEVCFTATQNGSARALHAVTLDGRMRDVASIPGTMNLFDVAKDGRFLIAQSDERIEAEVIGLHETEPRPIGWLDWSLIGDFSRDGKFAVLGESGEGTGDKYGVYLRKTDGSPAVRLGDGEPRAISPDGAWVAGLNLANAQGEQQLEIFPTGAGEARTLPSGDSAGLWVAWTPDSKSLLYAHAESDHTPRIYKIDIDGSAAPKPLTPAGERLNVAKDAVSPDGRSFVASAGRSLGFEVFPMEGGEGRKIPALSNGEFVMGWSSDGRSVYTATRADIVKGGVISKVDPVTGKHETLKIVLPADRAGFQAFDTMAITPDGQMIGYSFTRLLSTMYILQGAK